MKPITFTYKAVREDDVYIVSCLEWDRVFTSGYSYDHCVKMAEECTELHLITARESGEPLPEGATPNSPYLLTITKSKPDVFYFQLSFHPSDLIRICPK